MSGARRGLTINRLKNEAFFVGGIRVVYRGLDGSGMKVLIESEPAVEMTVFHGDTFWVGECSIHAMRNPNIHSRAAFRVWGPEAVKVLREELARSQENGEST